MDRRTLELGLKILQSILQRYGSHPDFGPRIRAVCQEVSSRQSENAEGARLYLWSQIDKLNQDLAPVSLRRAREKAAQRQNMLLPTEKKHVEQELSAAEKALDKGEYRLSIKHSTKVRWICRSAKRRSDANAKLGRERKHMAAISA